MLVSLLIVVLIGLLIRLLVGSGLIVSDSFVLIGETKSIVCIHHCYHNKTHHIGGFKVEAPEVCSFSEILKNFSERQILWSFVLGSFSCFCIEIAYSNFTFCGG